MMKVRIFSSAYREDWGQMADLENTNLSTESNKDAKEDKLTVLIADDHELLSHALSSALNSYGIEAFTAKSFQEALLSIRKHKEFDMVLLDLQMPGMQGLQSIKAVVKAAGASKVVLFTGDVEPDFLQSALDANVWGLIPKTISLKSMVGVIKLISTGEVFLPTNASTSVIRSVEKKNVGDFTQDEFLVLGHAANGLTNKEIAFTIGTSESRVKMLMRSVCGKVGAKNRAHAAVLCRELGIL